MKVMRFQQRGVSSLISTPRGGGGGNRTNVRPFPRRSSGLNEECLQLDAMCINSPPPSPMHSPKRKSSVEYEATKLSFMTTSLPNEQLKNSDEATSSSSPLSLPPNNSKTSNSNSGSSASSTSNSTTRSNANSPTSATPNSTIPITITATVTTSLTSSSTLTSTSTSNTTPNTTSTLTSTSTKPAKSPNHISVVPPSNPLANPTSLPPRRLSFGNICQFNFTPSLPAIVSSTFLPPSANSPSTPMIPPSSSGNLTFIPHSVLSNPLPSPTPTHSVSHSTSNSSSASSSPSFSLNSTPLLPYTCVQQDRSYLMGGFPPFHPNGLVTNPSAITSSSSSSCSYLAPLTCPSSAFPMPLASPTPALVSPSSHHVVGKLTRTRSTGGGLKDEMRPLLKAKRTGMRPKKPQWEVVNLEKIEPMMSSPVSSIFNQPQPQPQPQPQQQPQGPSIPSQSHSHFQHHLDPQPNQFHFQPTNQHLNHQQHSNQRNQRPKSKGKQKVRTTEGEEDGDVESDSETKSTDPADIETDNDEEQLETPILPNAVKRKAVEIEEMKVPEAALRRRGAICFAEPPQELKDLVERMAKRAKHN